MKVYKHIEIESQDVEIEITSEDINLVFVEEKDFANPDLTRILHINLSRAIQFLKGIPNEMAQNVQEDVKNLIIKELEGIIDKFKP